MLLSSLRPSRRALTPATVAVGLILGLTAAGGISGSVPAQADTGASTAARSGAAVTTSVAQPLSDITQDALDALADGRAALRAAAEAKAAADASALPLEVESTFIDTRELRGYVEQLTELEVTPTLLVPDITDDTSSATQRVRDAAAALTGAVEKAEAKKAAEEAARKAAEEAARKAAEEKAAADAAAAAAAEAAAERAASSRSVASAAPTGAPTTSAADAKAAARQMLGSYGWGDDQFSCLDSLWTRESGWNYQAYNASSGATGIPQALPGSKMASAGSDWQTNATTQIKWGLGYIAGRYGSPCAAWGHSQSTGWY
ncbi:hypothetical protein FVP74_07860 [Microbacterium saccharophilum]|uniref:Lytic transglycosylase domain-containing protein n=1 Tax=Microbacterium saccharophilum TaxID=1213358 RepID=A0A5C8I0V3_9MICO|nr:hypothetical protein [Microbacterium saccharophilum]TXK11252.1 hypothetical protein FVP74_07860 [Microbacterium saccharophilum]GEP48636.1 hypothetical protein MSA03_21440 [Microbacterium saccharophilum]